MPSELKNENHLINIIKDTRDHHPNFTLLLGAGASSTSGVSTAGKMIVEWREKYIRQNDKSKLEGASWHKRPEEYSVLFETLYDQPSQRREYIESCLKDAKPSWGYIYLVNLLHENIFNTVFTTNFDDLLNEACYLYSGGVRPLVCAHDSSVRALRITSQRPKIIKLHGDFLFDDIKNTMRELESLEVNMRDKFRQYAPEFGLIVVGYAGNDRSIMDNLNTLLRHETNYPHGVYWCVRSEKEITRQVADLARYPHFHLVRINGFDEFFAEINSALNLSLQDEMTNPYKAVSDRLNSLLDNANIPSNPELIHPVIKKDIESLTNKIKQQTASNENALTDDAKDFVLKAVENFPIPPFQLMAEVALRENKFQEAKEFVKRQIKNSPNKQVFVLASKIYRQSKDEELIDLLKNSLEKYANLLDDPSCNTISLELISSEQYDLAEKFLDLGHEIACQIQSRSDFLDEAYEINKAQILRHKKVKLPKNTIDTINGILNNSNEMIRMGCLIVLDKFDEAMDILEKIANSENLDWPLIKLFPAKYHTKINLLKDKNKS